MTIDALNQSLNQCMLGAAGQCMGSSRTRSTSNRFPCKFFWDEELRDFVERRKVLFCREGFTKQMRKAENNRFKKLLRAKEAAWRAGQSDKWVLLAGENPKAFWRAFRPKKTEACPVSQAEQLEYFRNLVGIEPSQGVLLQEQSVTDGAPQAAEQAQATGCLDADFVLEELLNVLKKLKPGKAAGYDGVIAEMILFGGSDLHELLLQMFNRMLQGEFPTNLSVGLITAVFKSGDKHDMGNYRGITVTPALAKVFAMLLKNRITEYMEGNNLRAEGQAGFRPDHRTVDNVFIMQQMLQHYQSKSDRAQRKLYACFVDFKKAFDTVDRCTLWQVLWDVGIRGRILGCIKAMYACDSAAVKTKEGISEIFRCYTGVKQGCALSPDLFGIFTDELEKVMKDLEDGHAPTFPVRMPHRGVLLGKQVPLQMYADDALLVSTTPQGLQNQLSALHTFCVARSLTVNVAKTKVMVFEKHSSESPSFSYDGHEIETVSQFKYLGLTFDASKGALFAPDELLVAGTKACNALRRRCAEMHIQDPLQMCKMFDALVKPILSYGCEIWALNPKAGEKAEMLHKNFLRSILRVPKHTSGVLVLAEFGRYPLQHSWWQQIMRYYNRLVKLCGTNLKHRLLPHAALTSVIHMSDSKSWCCRLGGWLAHLPPQGWSWRNNDMMKECVDTSAVIGTVKEQYLERQLRSEGLSSILRKYSLIKDDYEYEAYLSQISNSRLRILLTNFRLGNHRLGCQLAKRVKEAAQIEEVRRCKACGWAEEDEEHVLLHCPQYSRVRVKFSNISKLCLKDIFSHEDQLGVAKFVAACLAARDSALSKK